MSFQPTNSTMPARISFGTYWNTTSFKNCFAPVAKDSQVVTVVFSILAELSYLFKKVKFNWSKIRL